MGEDDGTIAFFAVGGPKWRFAGDFDEGSDHAVSCNEGTNRAIQGNPYSQYGEYCRKGNRHVVGAVDTHRSRHLLLYSFLQSLASGHKPLLYH